ncbi:unnamed protein product, partial [Soboliphyme baturini]|uniref:RGS domain-containing protein n=1 Tax=Soboliphyme baturini TaxID=241478 RepID=A0A183J888_9BILA
MEVNEVRPEFTDLLHRAGRLSAQVEPSDSGNPPKHSQTILEVLEEGDVLFKKIVVPSVTNETVNKKTDLLLESEGLTFPKYWMPYSKSSKVMEYGGVGEQEDVEEREPLTGFQRFLKSRREFYLSQFLEEVFEAESNKTRQNFWKDIHSDWERQEQALVNWLPRITSQIEESRMAYFKPADATSPTQMSVLQRMFADEVISYVEASFQPGGNGFLLPKFMGTVSAAEDKQGLKIWRQVNMLSDIRLSAHQSLFQQRASSKFA